MQLIEHDDFIDNKYHHTYGRIIDKALSENRRKSTEDYYESHHVFPTCVFGGSGLQVLLTPKEHYVCHWLLVKFTTGKTCVKLLRALNAMSNHKLSGREGKWSALEYRISREAFIEARRAWVQTEERKKRIGDTQRGKPKPAGHGAKIAAAQTGVPKPPGTGDKIAARLRGKSRSPEAIAKHRDTLAVKKAKGLTKMDPEVVARRAATRRANEAAKRERKHASA
jgi:hypothetical protein